MNSEFETMNVKYFSSIKKKNYQLIYILSEMLIPDKYLDNLTFFFLSKYDERLVNSYLESTRIRTLVTNIFFLTITVILV